MQHSNRVGDDERILQDAHLAQLRDALTQMHGKFARLYEADPEAPGSAMEIEFKITASGALAIEQARPWIFSSRAPGGERRSE